MSNQLQVTGTALFSAAGQSIKLTSASDVFLNVTRGASILNIGIDATGSFYNTSSNHRFLTNSGTITALTIASTGAATFSSSVTAGDFLRVNGDTIRIKNNASNLSYLRVEENASAAAFTYLTMDGRSSGYFAISTNDTERIRITSGGAINIKDGTLTGGGGFEFTSEAFFGARFQSNAYKFMAGNNTSEYMRITSGGNVLIGTTTDAGYKLDVGSTARFFNGDQGASRIIIQNTGSGGQAVNLIAGNPNVDQTGFSIAYGNTNFLRFASSGAATFSSSVTAQGGATIFSTTSDLQLLIGNGSRDMFISGATVAGTSQMIGIQNISGANRVNLYDGKLVITSGGNVGIGTSSPSSLLTVAGATDLAWSAGTSKLQILRSGSQARINNYESGSGSSIAIAWDGGSLLVGTTTDAGQKLQVNGTSNFSGLLTNYNVYNTQTSSYTLVIGDASKIVEMNVGSANTVTVPTNASVGFPIGTEITVMQYGGGVTTIASAGGVTINSKSNARIIANRYTGATLIKRGTDEWYLIGNIVV